MTMATCGAYIDRHPESVKSMVRRGQIPFHRVNGRLVFGKDEIDAWVLSGGSVLETPHITERSSVTRG